MAKRQIRFRIFGDILATRWFVKMKTNNDGDWRQEAEFLCRQDAVSYIEKRASELDAAYGDGTVYPEWRRA